MLSIVALLSAALTLQGARTLADQRNGMLRAARATAESARAAVDSAGQLTNPTASVSYGADDPKLQAGLEVKLPIFGQRGAAVHTAQVNARVASAQVSLEQARLHAGVRRSFSAFWAASQQAQIAAETAQLAGELAHLAAERYRTGGAPELEALQAQLAARRAAHDQEDRRAEAEATRHELEALVGAAVEAVEAPPLVRSAPEDLIARSALHPEIQALRLQEESWLSRAHEERLAVLPVPAVNVIAERFTDPSTYWGLRAGVLFDLPLLSWNRGKVREQEANARAANAQAQAARLRLEGAAQAAWARLSAAASRSSFYGGEFLESARKILEMARTGYGIGRTSLVAVLQAQTDLFAARSKAIDSALEAQRGLADLEEAVGEDL